jgi:hypothetical protein
MNKFITILSLLFLILPLRATTLERDSLRLFLEYVGEDSMTIAEIMKSPKITDPLKVLDSCLMYKLRLKYDLEEQKVTWQFGCEDSVFICRTTEYITQKVICDTALYLIDYFSKDVCNLGYPKYEEQIRIKSAEYAVKAFHARKAIAIPYVYYINHKELDNWQNQLRFYGMIDFILLEPKRLWCFEKEFNLKINKIIKEPNEKTSYYTQFRDLINSYSDIDLARISKEEEKELVNILLKGIEQGEKKSQITYAFMLLTGQFVEKDEILGQEILNNVFN